MYCIVAWFLNEILFKSILNKLHYQSRFAFYEVRHAYSYLKIVRQLSDCVRSNQARV